MYVSYNRYKFQSNYYWIEGILIKYMHLNFSKPGILSKQTLIKLNFRQTNCYFYSQVIKIICFHNKKHSGTIQCKNTANDLLIVTYFKVFMNNSIKTWQNNVFTQNTVTGSGYAYVSRTFRPMPLCACICFYFRLDEL